MVNIAEEQREALRESISSLEQFMSYASKSRYAVPAEADGAHTKLEEVYALMYPEGGTDE